MISNVSEYLYKRVYFQLFSTGRGEDPVMMGRTFPATLLGESQPAEKESLTLVTCPDKEFQCPDGDTCCQLKGREREQ